MNVTTVYELFSVIMQETFQHNNDFSITYKTNLCRFTQMQVGKVKYLYMIQNYIWDCALHQKNDSYNMKISDPLKLCAIIDTNNQNIYFMDFDFNWGFVLTQDQRLPARSMLFSEYINKTLKDIQNNIIKKYMDELDFTYYYVYLMEDNPRYAISLIQKKMEDRVIFLQKETSRLNFNIQSLDKKIILLNEEKLEEHDKN